jgi:hypothetical protein
MTHTVTGQCPACGHQFIAGIVDDQSWWGKGVKPASVVNSPYCVRCQHPPPMLVVKIETQPGRWEQANLFQETGS